MKRAAALLVVGSACLGATIHVPADHSTIQAGLDAAADGDTVLVAPGEYVITQPIDFNRLHDPDNPGSPPLKNLTLRSEARRNAPRAGFGTLSGGGRWPIFPPPRRHRPVEGGLC